ncbi:MAG: NlpC/P60 family protein [Bacteroidota bacterium]
MLEGSRMMGAVLFLGATLALVGFTLAPASVPTAPAAPVSTDAPATAPRSQLAPADTVQPVADTRAVSAAEATHHAMVASAIRTEGQDWLGTPYRWGGTTRRGIDCSAFVQQLVQQTFDIELPRTTATQVHRGVRISRDDLVPGDLVFFRRRGVRHVGVYLGGGEFIHASSSRGVTVSTMESGYWARYYWQSRRILPEFEAPTPEPRLVRTEAREASRAVDSARGFRRH